MQVNEVPSSPTLRQRLDAAAASEKANWNRILLEESADLLYRINAPLTGIAAGDNVYVPFDLDVSPFDNSGTKKEGVSRTYKGTDGYAPMFAYMGHAGVFAYNLLRIMGQESLREDDAPIRGNVKRRRIRTVIQNIVYMAARFVRHAGRIALNFGSNSPWFLTARRIYQAFA
jgi:hypothetical protein